VASFSAPGTITLLGGQRYWLTADMVAVSGPAQTSYWYAPVPAVSSPEASSLNGGPWALTTLPQGGFQIRGTPTIPCAVTSGNDLPFGPAAQTGSYTLNFNRAGCAWSVSSNVPWFVLTPPTSGTASGTSVTIPYSIAANTTSAPRTGVLAFSPNYYSWSGGEIQQNSSNCTFTLSPATITVPASGGTSSPLSVSSSPAGCWWKPNQPSWANGWSDNTTCTANTFCLTTGPSTVTFPNIQANTGAGRSATVTSGTDPPSSASFVLSQAGTTSPVTMSCSPAAGPATVGAAYSASCAVSGGTAPYSWSINPGSLPSGLTFTPSGASATISGTPTTAGSYSYTAQVFDSGIPRQPVTQAYSGFINPAAAVSASPPSMTFSVRQGDPNPPAQSIAVSSSGTSLSFTISATTVSGGNWLSVSPTSSQTLANLSVSVNSSGLAAGSYTGQLAISAPNASPSSVTVPVTLTVLAPAALSCSPTTGPLTVGVSYSATCTTSGGTAPYTWSISSGALPGGIALNPSGASATISGTPTTAGSYSYTVQVFDSGIPRQPVNQSYSGFINPAAAVSASPSSLTFSVRQGDPNPSAQTLAVSSSGASLSFTISATTVSGGNWLSVSPTSSQTLANLSVSVNSSGLAAGNYSGQLTISAPNASPSSVTVPVTLTVLALATLTCSPTTGPVTVGVSYSATCTASGGTAPYTWSINPGALPGGIALTPSGASATISGTPAAAGSYSYTVRVADSGSPAQSASQLYSGTINPPAAPSTLTVAPASLTFSARADDASPPARQSLSVFSNVTATPFTASASTASGGNWLSVSPASGQTAGSVAVTVNVAGLAPGNYSGQIAIASPNASPTSVAIPVTLTILAVPPSQLDVSPRQLTISSVQGGAAVQQQLVVSNLGGGAIDFTGSASGGNWLSLTATSGRASSSSPASVGLTVSPQGLPPSTYNGTIVIRSADGTQSQTVPVTLAVNAFPQSILLSQTGMQFTAVAKGVAPPPQAFSILNTGLGAMDWSVIVQPVSGGSGWLSVTPGTGSSLASAPTPPSVSVSVDPGNLAAGQYYGLVRVSATGAGNSPQTVTVSVNVLAPTLAPAPLVSQVGLLPVGAAGTGNLASTVTLSNLAAQSSGYSSTASTQDGGNWLAVSPASGTVPASASSQVSVQVNTTGLSAGVRNGLVRLAFPDGTVRTITVVSLLTAGASGGASLVAEAVPAAGCQPSSTLAMVSDKLEDGFTVTAAQPVPLEIQVKDSCGAPMQDGGVRAAPTNGDPQLDLTHQGGGVWTATWPPRGIASPVHVVVLARAPQQTASGLLDLKGTVQAAPSTARAAPAVVLNSASYLGAGQISPGSWVSIFGDRMAEGTSTATAAPYPPGLGGTQVQLNDTALPVLYVSPSQVNALIPYSLTANTVPQLLIQRSGTVSVGLGVTLADVEPAIYAVNQQGTGQGAILISNTGILAAPPAVFPGARAVKRGEYLEVYCTGLGAVNNPPAAGVPAPTSEPLATTVATPVVTIGGVQATVVGYSGLAPGVVGLYQINVQVPANAPTGDAVPVVVAVGNATSNTVTVAVQ
jgi:uncharacterized protein (TIGR03437 family)